MRPFNVLKNQEAIETGRSEAKSCTVLYIYSIPANNAIYQAAPAFVFILSVPLLREKVTVTKVRWTAVLRGLDRT